MIDVIRVHDDPSQIDGEDWDRLLALQSRPTPFMHHAYFVALHRSGSAVAATGWSPQFVTVRRGGHLVAAAPAYLKSHSYGEYVFDWAWADAYQRHGLAYYPKLLVAVPFTPVPGNRLMAIDVGARRSLVAGLRDLAASRQVSSTHLLFHEPEDAGAVAQWGWLSRQGVQFHWTQRTPTPWQDFDDFLVSLQREKRKKILQERRKVREAGIDFTVHHAHQITSELWDFFHHCYLLTYRAHQSKPYLTKSFFREMALEMTGHWVMFVARRAGLPIGASLVAVDAARGQAYGRYWGATEHVPCLHFEACYYQPLAWCISQGFHRFEGGAQGEHKMARGLMPVATQSSHWLAHPEFSQAVAEFLAREGSGVAAYVDELRDHSPYKATP